MSTIINKLKAFGFHFIVLLFAIIMLYPLLWMISSSFKTSTEIFQGSSFFPTTLNFDNYISGWKGLSGITFGVFFKNSFVIVILAVMGNLISCSLTAYAFAKLNFPLKRFLFVIMLSTLMLPLHVKLIPQYIVFLKLDLINSIVPMVLPKFFATDAFFVFLMTQYMRGLPVEIDNASKIDGCSFFQHYIKIILPLSLPALVTTSIFTFIWTWNDFFSQLLYLSEPKLYTVAIALRNFTDSTGGSSWGSLFAMSTLSLMPLFLIFVIFQKYLVEGITSGSIKG